MLYITGKHNTLCTVFRALTIEKNVYRCKGRSQAQVHIFLKSNFPLWIKWHQRINDMRSLGIKTISSRLTYFSLFFDQLQLFARQTCHGNIKVRQHENNLNWQTDRQTAQLSRLFMCSHLTVGDPIFQFYGMAVKHFTIIQQSTSLNTSNEM